MAHRFSTRRYARALFELGVRQDQLDKWQVDLDRVVALSGDPEVLAYLNHPKVSLEAKSALLSRNMQDIAHPILNLVYLLIERDALERLPDVANEYGHQLNEYYGIESGKLSAVVSLDEAAIQKISRRVGDMLKKKVVLEGVIDEKLLGGVVVRIGDTLLDGSIRTALFALKQRLSYA